MKPFDHNKFVGYVCEVTPQYVRLQIPSVQNYYIHSILMEKSFRVALLAVLLLLKVKNTVS